MDLRTLGALTFVGPPAEARTLATVPAELRQVLAQVNGFVAYRGALHVRGACDEPEWHSLHAFWTGPLALHREYPTLNLDDVPFGQDCVGDQFVLRHQKVMRLAAETGEIEEIAPTLDAFWASVQADPVEALGMHPLLQLEQDGGALLPGHLIHAYPPFCVDSPTGVSLRAIPALEVIRVHARLVGELADLPDGSPITIEPVG